VVGDFEVGKEFDAIIVDTRSAGAFDVFASDTPLDAFQKFINLGDDRHITAVFVKGRRVR
jgi:guanine deaminase